MTLKGASTQYTLNAEQDFNLFAVTVPECMDALIRVTDCLPSLGLALAQSYAIAKVVWETKCIGPEIRGLL